MRIPRPAASSSHLLGYVGREEGGPVCPRPQPLCVSTPTFFNEGHGIQLLRVFVTLLQLSPCRRNTAQKDHPRHRSPISYPTSTGSRALGSPPSLTSSWCSGPLGEPFSGSLSCAHSSFSCYPWHELTRLGRILPPFLGPPHTKAQFGVPLLSGWVIVNKYDLFSGPASPFKWETILNIFCYKSPRPFFRFLRWVLPVTLCHTKQISPRFPSP